MPPVFSGMRVAERRPDRREAGAGTAARAPARNPVSTLPQNGLRTLPGPVAQRSELAAHNRLVGGSNPPGPTTMNQIDLNAFAHHHAVNRIELWQARH